jgi:hypothetical protein
MYLQGSTQLSGFLDFLNTVKTDIAQAWDSVTGAVSSGVTWAGDQARAGVRDFRAKFADLNSRIEYLDNHYPKASAPKVQWDEYNTLMASLRDTQAKAQTVDDQIRAFEKSVGVSLSGLGAVQLLEIPAVLVAAIIGAVYILSKGIDAAQRYQERNSYIDAATASGQSATAAMAAYDAKNPAGGGGLFGDVSKIVIPVAIIAGLVYLAKGKR